MKKRILALILTVAMMVAVLPFAAIPASAADDDGIVGKWYATQDDGRTGYSRATNLFYTFGGSYWTYAQKYQGESFYDFPRAIIGGSAYATYDEAIAAGMTGATLRGGYFTHATSGLSYNPDDLSNADFGENPYLAIRMIFKDMNGTVNYNPAALKICLGNPDEPSERAYATNKQKAADGSTMLWVDANDGSCTRVFPTGLTNYYSYQYLTMSGYMNGYLLIPVSMFGTSTSITDAAAYLKSANSKLGFEFYNYNVTAETAGTKTVNWNNKHLYVGDMYIVDDTEAFTSNYIAKNGMTKYDTGYDDSAYIAQRVPATMMSLYGLGVSSSTDAQVYKSSSTKLYGATTYGGGSTAGNYMHVVSLPNGDHAYDVTASAATASYNVFPTNMYTYDHSNGQNESTLKTNTSSTFVKTDLTQFAYTNGGTGLAARVCTTGNEGKTITVAFCPDSADGIYYKFAVNGAVVDFIDAKTGAVSKITMTSSGVPLTGNVDGWVVFPNNKKNEYTSATFFDGRATFAGVNLNIKNIVDTTQKVYVGDIRFFNDYEKYMGVHSGDTSLDIRSASLALEDNLALNVKINKRKYEDKYTFGTPKATFTYVENTKDVAGTVAGNSYNFKLTGLAVQRAIDALDAAVYSPDGTNSGRTLTTAAGGAYSVKQYCVNQLASTTDAKLKTLLTDLLNYAAEAQLYTGYNKHALANDGIDQSNATADLEAVDRNKMSHVALDGAAYTWKSASLRLTDTVEIKLNFNGEPAEGMYVKVTDEKDNVIWDKYRAVLSGSFTFNALNADQMRDVVKFTLYNADGTQASGTLSYSIEAYVAAKVEANNDPELVALVTAMMKYGDAAIAYRN